MAIEKSVIVDELKAQGISEALGNGLSFETPEELSGWVEAYKTGLPKAKEIQDYTKEEIEAIAKDPQFKGAKGLQGYLDSLRKPAPEKKTEGTPDFAALIAESQKPLLEQLAQLTAQKQTETFANQVKQAATLAGITDEEFINDIKESLPSTATPEEIKAKVEKKKAYLTKLGVKNFGTPGGGEIGNKGDLEAAMKEWNKKQDLRKNKK